MLVLRTRVSLGLIRKLQGLKSFIKIIPRLIEEIEQAKTIAGIYFPLKCTIILSTILAYLQTNSNLRRNNDVDKISSTAVIVEVAVVAVALADAVD